MKNMTRMDPDRLKEHIFSTYITLRYGIGAITLTFPIVVWLAGVCVHVELQHSLSAYYWASDIPRNIPRVFFVGGLFAVASFLYLYKGFTVAENIAFNLAAIFAIGVAVVPMPWDGKLDATDIPWHYIFAVSMFVCLVYVVWFRARDTLKFLPDADRLGPVTQPHSRKWYQVWYAAIGFVMLVTPVWAALLNFIFGRKAYVFFIESTAVWAFSLYWFFKSAELKRSIATRRGLRAEIAI